MTINQSITALCLVVALVVGYLFLPVWQAQNLLDGADTAAESCAAGENLANAWGGLGFHEKADDIKSSIVFKCYMASIR